MKNQNVRLAAPKKKSVENNNVFKKVIEEANVELKANAIKCGANAILGYDMNLTTTTFGSKNYVIVSVTERLSKQHKAVSIKTTST